MKKNYDVIVIGGGPAGGQTSRNLSKRGYRVLLVEKYSSFAENNFSSAGMTLEPMSEFSLPESIVGAYWNDLVIQCTQNSYTWKGNEPKGVVLNFQKLREFLANETRTNGGDVLMGYRYVKKEIIHNGVRVFLNNSSTKKTEIFESKMVVDATGPLRKVMFDTKEEQPEMTLGSGTEYEIEVEQEIYDRFKDKLLFFLGHKWAIKGYSWIFPMENRILKVGAGKTHIKSKDQEDTNKTTRKITEKIIEEYLGTSSYKIIDMHGGIIRYSPGLKDVFFKYNVVGVGDTISAINPRGGEGIRYAMQSADLACQYIDEYLKTGVSNFDQYQKEWKKRKGFKWRLSELSARRMYSRYSDEQVENRVQFFHKNFSTEAMIESLFNFKYNKVVFRFFQLLWLKTSFALRNKKF
ncbi:MAG: NAD(P)/FAD-dependent oxidoreductase [Polaribacter sp.]